MDSLQQAPRGAVCFGPFVLDAGQARLLKDGRPVALSGRPLALLSLLAARPGQLVSKDELLDGVWGHRHVSESVLKVALNAVRAALGDDPKAPRFVATVPRRGLRFVAEVLPADSTSEALPGSAAAPGAGGLVGRAEERRQLSEALRSQRLVTLHGPAGVGKTALALACAPHEAPADGVCVLRLDGLRSAEELLPALAEALKLGPLAAQDAAAAGRALQRLAMRIVADNAEHLVEAVAALVGPLLDTAPGVQWLVTSQVPLRIAGEHVIALPPLAGPAGTAPDPMSYAAGECFVAGVRRHDPGYLPTAADHAEIATICLQLDGLPLALEFAAARVPVLGCAGVRQRLHERFTLLTRAPRGASPRHRSLATALDWTVDLLPPEVRRALHRLSLFAASFTAEAAEGMLGAGALDALETLREHALLALERGARGVPRLRLYDSVRRHAALALEASGDGSEAQADFVRWARRHAERGANEEFDTPLLQWLPAQRDDLPNLRAALAIGWRLAGKAMAHDDERVLAMRDDVQRIVAASAPLAYRSGYRLEGWDWLQRARALPALPPTTVLLNQAFGVFSAFAQI